MAGTDIARGQNRKFKILTLFQHDTMQKDPIKRVDSTPDQVKFKPNPI